jgi:hypothetical protein
VVDRTFSNEYLERSEMKNQPSLDQTKWDCKYHLAFLSIEVSNPP